jgi:hypothetical protein
MRHGKAARTVRGTTATDRRPAPGKPGDLGRTAEDNRLFVDGVLWVLRSGMTCRSDMQMEKCPHPLRPMGGCVECRFSLDRYPAHTCAYESSPMANHKRQIDFVVDDESCTRPFIEPHATGMSPDLDAAWKHLFADPRAGGRASTPARHHHGIWEKGA